MTDQEKLNSLVPAFEAAASNINPAKAFGGDSTVYRKKALHNFYKSSRIIQNIVKVLPDKATKTAPRYFEDDDESDTADANQKKLTKGLESIRLSGTNKYEVLTWRKFLNKALILGDLEGNSYIILGEKGNTNTELPLGENPITWLAIRTKEQLYTDNTGEFYTAYKTSDQGVDVERDIANRRFHKTRIIKLYGIENFDLSYYRYDYSVLQPVMCTLQSLEHIFETTTDMVEQHSLYVHKIDNLTETLAKKGLGALQFRFESILSGIKNLGGIFIDRTKEETEIMSRNYGGVDSLIEKYIDWFVANTGLPRFVVLGQSQSNSLSSSADQEQNTLNGLVNDYQHQKLLPILEIIAQRKANELGLGELTISFPPTFPLTEKEEAEIRSVKADAALKELNYTRLEETPILDPNADKGGFGNEKKKEKPKPKEDKKKPEKKDDK